MKIILLIMIGLSLVQAEFLRDHTKEVVLDTTTNLMWQDDSDAKTITKNWLDAIDYCEAKTLGGYSDWRLPNKNELYNLADRTIYNPALSPVYQNFSSSAYWSSTTAASSTSLAWVAGFYYGGDGWGTKTRTYFVRCVR